MPFNEQNRRDSWPPTIIHLNGSAINDIDEDPFPYFLTSSAPEDTGDEFGYFEDLTAGIEAGDEMAIPIREVSPSAIQRVPYRAEHDSHSSTKDIKSSGIPLSFRGFKLARESSKHDKAAGPPPDDLEFSTSTARGRSNLRLTSRRESRGRGKARSLSAPKAHSWREPSPEVYPIAEEREEESTPQPSSTTTHAQPQASISREEDATKATKKMKKVVRWALA